ncbi:MAG: UPF0489 family protein [Vulcanimicrobiota bacterium]
MFLHEDPKPVDDPGEDLNFLWKDPRRSLYIMDNHRAALWCWLREIRRDHTYSLLHIDWHWDSAKPYGCCFSGLENMTLAAMLALRDTRAYFSDRPAICWDDFIFPMLKLRPKFHRGIFVCHQSRGEWKTNALSKHPRCKVFPFQVFWEDLDFRELSGRAILDLDLDYFFFDIDGRKVLAYSEEFISRSLQWLDRNLPEDAVISIALSPSCCGDLAGCLKVLRLACAAFRVQTPNLDAYYPGYTLADSDACGCDCSDADLMSVPESAWLPVVETGDED